MDFNEVYDTINADVMLLTLCYYGVLVKIGQGNEALYMFLTVKIP